MNTFRSLGATLITSGIQTIQKSYKPVRNPITYGFITNAFINVGLNIPVAQMDINYLTTTLDIWQDFFEYAKEIAKNFKWTAEYFDCDNRSAFIKTLADCILGVNTCCLGYGVVLHKDTGATLFRHWFDIIVLTDGTLYIFDIDNNGGMVKIEKDKNPVIGNWRYKIESVRAY